ncbi:MAG: hypothetical protein WCF45_10705 [Photobacterium halotolerans]
MYRIARGLFHLIGVVFMGSAVYYSYLAVTDGPFYWLLAYNYLWCAIVSLLPDITRYRDNESYPSFLLKNAFIPTLLSRAKEFNRLQDALSAMLEEKRIMTPIEIQIISHALVHGNIGQMRDAICEVYSLRNRREGAAHVEA